MNGLGDAACLLRPIGNWLGFDFRVIQEVENNVKAVLNDVFMLLSFSLLQNIAPQVQERCFGDGVRSFSGQGDVADQP